MLNEDKIIGLYDEINHLHRDLENLNAELKTKNLIIDQATSESLAYKQKYAEKDKEVCHYQELKQKLKLFAINTLIVIQ